MIEICFANATDLQAIRELLTTCRLPADDLQLYLHDFLVAKNGKSLIGCVGVERFEKVALLRSLAVQQEFRGNGIARELCSRLEQQISGMDVYLLTTTAADFFVKIGYCRINREEAPLVITRNKQFTSLCPSTAALMRKNLSARAV
jgi:amino-acid N-acetyltransferase